MSSQIQTNRVNRYSMIKNQITQSEQTTTRQRSNSGKKILIIRRKLSTPSKLKQSSQASTIQSQNPYQQHQTRYTYVQKSTINNDRNLQRIQNIILNSNQNYQSNNYDTRQSKSQSQNTLQVSRGQFYENQLDSIQKEIQFFRFELQRTHSKNLQLQEQIQSREISFQQFVRIIYSHINKLFSKKYSSLFFSLITNLISVDQQIYFSKLTQKISGLQTNAVQMKQVQNDVIFALTSLYTVISNQNQLPQVINSQEISLNELMGKVNSQKKEIDFLNKQIFQLEKEIHELNRQNSVLNSEKMSLNRIISAKQRVKKVNVTSQTDEEYLKLSKSLDRSKKTADASRQEQEKKKTFRNTQIQTEQKRIGSAASIHKYKSYRFSNSPNQSPYKTHNVLNKVAGDCKFIPKLAQQLPQVQTVKKPATNKFIKDKKQPQRKTVKLPQKKKTSGTPSYMNHLIQSQNFIKGQDTVETIRKEPSKLIDSNGNTRSQLSIRRPIHRSRSHSQQQVPSSRQRSNSKNSVNNVSSRVSSTYSLNPVDKYGQRRLCNEVNSRKIRKITQLSQQSQELEERMKQLIQQEKQLKQKYKQLEEIKVSRQVKKSRLNKSIDKPNTYVPA